MFHKYIAIILKERIWTTQGNNDIDYCLIFLIYSGGVHFHDTCTGMPSVLFDYSMSDLENVDQQIDAINLSRSSVKIVLKLHPVRMCHSAPRQNYNCASTCSTCYGLRSSVPKKPVKPTRNARNSNKVLLNLNTLLAHYWQATIKRMQRNTRRKLWW